MPRSQGRADEPGRESRANSTETPARGISAVAHRGAVRRLEARITTPQPAERGNLIRLKLGAMKPLTILPTSR